MSAASALQALCCAALEARVIPGRHLMGYGAHCTLAGVCAGIMSCKPQAWKVSGQQQRAKMGRNIAEVSGLRCAWSRELANGAVHIRAQFCLSSRGCLSEHKTYRPDTPQTVTHVSRVGSLARLPSFFSSLSEVHTRSHTNGESSSPLQSSNSRQLVPPVQHPEEQQYCYCCCCW